MGLGAAFANDVEPGHTSTRLTPSTIHAIPALPITGESEESAIVHLQILLDRVNYSPGIIDGAFGQNTERALYWFQEVRGLEATGEVDVATYERLRDEAQTTFLVGIYRVSAEDLEESFVDVPPRNYQRVGMDWLGYGSALEMLSERFHASQELVEKLNPEVDFEALEPGQVLYVPNVEVVHPNERLSGEIDAIVILPDENYLHALDAQGEVLFHFPVTVGTSYEHGRFERMEITGIAYEPEFYYQPGLHGGPSGSSKATLAPGPNSVVGLVWIALDEPGYGIHGTNSPETIGYATSLGCVRLTNWDAIFLANRVQEGIPVYFR